MSEEGWFESLATSQAGRRCCLPLCGPATPLQCRSTAPAQMIASIPVVGMRQRQQNLQQQLCQRLAKSASRRFSCRRQKASRLNDARTCLPLPLLLLLAPYQLLSGLGSMRSRIQPAPAPAQTALLRNRACLPLAQMLQLLLTQHPYAAEKASHHLQQCRLARRSLCGDSLSLVHSSRWPLYQAAPLCMRYPGRMLPSLLVWPMRWKALQADLPPRAARQQPKRAAERRARMSGLAVQVVQTSIHVEVELAFRSPLCCLATSVMHEMASSTLLLSMQSVDATQCWSRR